MPTRDPILTDVLAAARLGNAHRRTAADLYDARSLLLKDAAMFANLMSLAAEFETEAEGFVQDHLGIVSVLERRFGNALAKIKSARADAQKTIADAGKVVNDAGSLASDAAATAKPITAAVAAATTAGTTVLPVAQAVIGDVVAAASAASAAASSLAVAGPGIAAGAKVAAIDTASSAVILDTPTNADHVGDGTEQVTITPVAATA